MSNQTDKLRILAERAIAEERFVNVTHRTVTKVADLLDELAAKIKHCPECGGSWVDDGINSGCMCVRVRELEKAAEAAKGPEA